MFKLYLFLVSVAIIDLAISQSQDIEGIYIQLNTTKRCLQKKMEHNLTNFKSEDDISKKKMEDGHKNYKIIILP